MERIIMGISFNPSEILEMAVQIERNGQKFYKKAAKILKEPDVKQFLLDLAEMEAKHEKIFKDMKAQLTESEKQVNVFDPDNEAVLYLQAMADGHVFQPNEDISAKLTGNESLMQIFKMAIQAEKDSIVFYIGLKDYVPDAASQKKVQKIIEEEKNHIVVLNDHLKLYN